MSDILSSYSELYWSDQTPVDFTKWHEGQPDDDGGRYPDDDCVQFNYMVNGEWHVEDCFNQAESVCKKNAANKLS